MCKYCKNAMTKDDLEYMLDEKMSLGLFGNILFEAYISTSGKLEVNIDGETPDGTFIGNQPVIVKELDIKYCPFCGQDLSYFEED